MPQFTALCFTEFHIKLHFLQTRFVATLHWASPLVPFFQQAQMVAFLPIKYFLIKVYTIFFRHNAIAHIKRPQYSVNIYRVGNQKSHVTPFVVMLAVLQWSETKPAPSPRSACAYMLHIVFYSVLTLTLH